MELASGPARLELLSLGRTDGGRVAAHLRLTTETETGRHFRRALEYQSSGEYDIGGIALVDVVGNKLYFPLRTTTGECLCTTVPRELPAGGSLDLHAVYPAPPEEVARVTIWAPRTTPFHDVELAAGQVAPVPTLTVDPSTAELAAPTIRSLLNNAEGLEQSTDEEGENRRIRISADVLFEIDKANLGPEAQRILKGVAKEIDASSDEAVEVDGYTDNTGTNRHNKDLSERRAESVVNALKGLVTRSGVTFRAEGHGEDDPVASNEAEEGRRLNRRVAVSFTRPTPTRPSAPPAASGSGAFTWSDSLPVIGTLRPRAEAGAGDVAKRVENLQYDINALHRDSTGSVSLVWTVTNKGTEEMNLSIDFKEHLTSRYEGGGTGGVMLVDPAAKVRYGPLRDDEDVCLCFHGLISGNYILDPGEQAVYSGLYKLPEDVTAIDVQIPFYSSSHTIPGLKIG
ncbi:OmpA family protein [Actinocorallia aurantiaca]|uniref:OmpA family protein n=1 Tax=Actinocorallia aurantiaca TaxID=46204 RepID=UPI0031D6F34E